MAKSIVFSALAIGLFLSSAALAGPDAEPQGLLRWLEAPEPRLATGEWVASTGSALALSKGQSEHLFFRFLPVAELIDGGPNIDGADRGSNTYEEAFWPGYGMNVECWYRAIQNAYLTFAVGGAVFPGGQEMTTIDDYDYKLDDYMPFYLSIGAAFAAPVPFLLGADDPDDDVSGLLAFFSFDAGIRYAPAVEMTFTRSPGTAGYPDLTGVEMDYWSARVGFQGSVHLGLELRLGPFGLVADVGVRTFGKPTSDTDPKWWAAGQAMITYPMRLGLSIRF